MATLWGMPTQPREPAPAPKLPGSVARTSANPSAPGTPSEGSLPPPPPLRRKANQMLKEAPLAREIGVRQKALPTRLAAAGVNCSTAPSGVVARAALPLSCKQETSEQLARLMTLATLSDKAV